MRPGKAFIASVIIAFCAAASAAAPEMIVITSATYDSGGEDRAYAVTADADGNIFLTGNTGQDYLSQKYSKTLVVSPTAQVLYTNGL